MNELEELYTNICFILQNKYMLEKSMSENLFDMDYIKVFVLILAYLHLCNVPYDILNKCISGYIDDVQYEEIYSFLSNKWEEKAKIEIEDIIYKIETGEDL